MVRLSLKPCRPFQRRLSLGCGGIVRVPFFMRYEAINASKLTEACT